MIYYMSICHSQHGDVPGKASNNRAWYPWGGVEHRCDDFSYVVVDGEANIIGGWSKALLALLAPLKVWHLTKFWDDRG